MKIFALFLGGMSLLSAGAAKADCVDPLASSASDVESQYRVEVCKLVNQNRVAAKAVALTLDLNLSKMAQDYARDMFQRNYFSHIDPDGHDFAYRLKQYKIKYSYAGENIAYGYTTPAEVMKGWMNSSGHKKNILNTKFRKLGVGYYQNYWVQEFTN